jgi:hypothetical protein
MACGTCSTQNQQISCTGITLAGPVAVGVDVSIVAVGTSVWVRVASIVGVSVSVGNAVGATAVGVPVGGVPQAVLINMRVNVANKSSRRGVFIFLSFDVGLGLIHE